VFAATIVLGTNPGPAYAKDPDLMSLSMEHFRDSATVKEDAQGDAVISTEKGFVEHTGPLRMVWKDEFLSSVVDQKTGQKSFRINAWIIYSGRWRSYQTASYQSNTGLQSVPADKIGAEAANCAVGDCTYTERLAFPIDEELLRRLAAQYTPGKPALWSYRFVANSGPDFAGGLSNAEIAGLLAKVDDLTHSTPAIAAHVAGAALKLDLGINGIPVAGSANYPNRAGVLITGVDGGSVAEASGIIVGDILFEFDAHPIKALAELQAAVAACGANCAATIKLYRGLEAVSVTAR
jgi:PDZ domain